MCDIPDVGVVNGHTMVKVSSQPHCRENRRYGGPGVLHCENQQVMVPGYGYQFYGSSDGPRWKDRHYRSPSVPQLGNQSYESPCMPRYGNQQDISHIIERNENQRYGGCEVPRWENQCNERPCMLQSGNPLSTQLKSRVRRSGESLPELSQVNTRLVLRPSPRPL